MRVGDGETGLRCGVEGRWGGVDGGVELVIEVDGTSRPLFVNVKLLLGVL